MNDHVHGRSVEVLDTYRLRLTFSDGASGVIDFAAELWGPLFEPLKDPARFAEVRVDPECGTIAWPNGADFAPEWLYEPRPRARQPRSKQKAPTEPPSRHFGKPLLLSDPRLANVRGGR